MNAKTILRKRLIKWKSIAVIFAACFLIGVPPLSAQNYGGESDDKGQKKQQQQQYQEPTQQQPSDFSEEDLKKFAEAKTEVDELRSKYSEALGRVDEPEKAGELQDKYGQQMVDSIREKDLSVKKYNEISRAMQGNPELEQKIDKITD